MCDTELFAPDLPTLCVGLRGLVYTEIEAVGAKVDLHSGMYGGAAPNPFSPSLKSSAGSKTPKGRFSFRVSTKMWRRRLRLSSKPGSGCPSTKKHYRKTEVGSTKLTGEPGYSVLYRTWARPTSKSMACREDLRRRVRRR